MDAISSGEFGMDDLAQRIERIEAESQIRQLVARYCFTIDDRDLEGLAALYTDSARMRSADGVMDAIGLDAIMDMWRGRFAALGPGQHVTHDLVIDEINLAAGTARGRVSSHAEVERNGISMIGAVRYYDEYRRTTDGWKFAERLLRFLYYVPVSRYDGILGERHRNLAYAEPKLADFPEALPGWNAFHRE